MPEEMSSPEISQPTPKETGQEGITPEKPISEWGIGVVEERLRKIKERLLTSGGKAPELESEIVELADRKKQLFAPGTRQAEKLRSLIQAGKYRDSDYRRSEGRIESACSRLFSDNPKLQEEVEEANLDLIRAEYDKLKNMQKKPSASEVKVDLQPLIDQIVSGQESLLRSYEAQNITIKNFLRSSQAQTRRLAESLGRLPIEKERARWVDVEYKQQFYTRFTPNLEPRFYTELRSTKERDLFDARWQLARAAYYKKAMSAFPEKLWENQDLQMLGKEQMERLYNMQGVQEALEWYAEVIVSGRGVIELPDPKKPGKSIWKNIWDCQDETDFETIRKVMREKEQVLREVVKKDENGIVRDKKGRKIKIELDALAQREADAVAWNLMWVSNLVESADSRYSYSGKRHGFPFPGVLVSDDLRSTFHMQEKFESKCWSGLEWGAFGKWGINHVDKDEIKKIAGKEYEFEFRGAFSPEDFWRIKRKKRPVFKKEEGKKKEVEKKGLLVMEVPECYPVTSMMSFWEETTVKEDTEEGKKFKEKLVEKKELLPKEDPSLLHYLLHRRPIPWEKVEGDAPWISYLPIKLNKAVSLFEYFRPGKPMETQKFGYAKTWADPLINIYRRLLLDKVYEGLLRVKKLRVSFRNLKVWAVYAAYGGVAHVDRRQPRLNLGTVDKWALGEALKDKNIKYFERGENLQIK